MQYVIFLYLSNKNTKLKADKSGKTKIFRIKTPQPKFRKADPNQTSYSKQVVQKEIAKRLKTYYWNLI